MTPGSTAPFSVIAPLAVPLPARAPVAPTVTAPVPVPLPLPLVTVNRPTLIVVVPP